MLQVETRAQNPQTILSSALFAEVSETARRIVKNHPRVAAVIATLGSVGIADLGSNQLVEAHPGHNCTANVLIINRNPDRRAVILEAINGTSAEATADGNTTTKFPPVVGPCDDQDRVAVRVTEKVNPRGQKVISVQNNIDWRVGLNPDNAAGKTPTVPVNTSIPFQPTPIVPPTIVPTAVPTPVRPPIVGIDPASCSIEMPIIPHVLLKMPSDVPAWIWGNIFGTNPQCEDRNWINAIGGFLGLATWRVMRARRIANPATTAVIIPVINYRVW